MITPRGLVSLSPGAEANTHIAMALGVIFSHDRTACWNASPASSSLQFKSSSLTEDLTSPHRVNQIDLVVAFKGNRANRVVFW